MTAVIDHLSLFLHMTSTLSGQEYTEHIVILFCFEFFYNNVLISTYNIVDIKVILLFVIKGLYYYGTFLTYTGTHSCINY